MKSVVEVYSSMAKQYPAWTADEEKAFIRTCTTSKGKWKSKAMKDRFVNEALKRNLNLMFKVVNSTAFKKDDEDIIQRAVIALGAALEKYDPARGYKVSTWVVNPIRWAVQQARGTYSKEVGIADEVAALNRKHGTRLCVVSIDRQLDSDDGSNDTLGSVISEKNIDPGYASVCGIGYANVDAGAREDEIKGGVAFLVSKMSTILNKKEIVVVKWMLKGKNMAEIATKMKLSRMRISQLFANASEKIRKSRYGAKLKGLLG